MMPRFWIITTLCLLISIHAGHQVKAESETATAFVHVNLIPMTREAVIPDQTVLIRGKHIVAVGPSGQIQLPDNTHIISGENSFLMPCLADMHMHIPFQVGLDGVLAEGMNEIAHIEELLWEFVDFDRSLYFESEAAWMNYVIHTTFHQLEPLLALTPGEIEKRFEKNMAAMIEKLSSRNIPFCTTLVVDDVIVQKLFDPEGFIAKPENRYLPTWYLNLFRQGKEKHQQQFKGGEAFAPFKYLLDKLLLKRLKQAGIPLLLSTDSGTGGMGIVPGFSIQDELRILVENGFTPYEAIASGTVTASGVIQEMTGIDDFGTIEPGKRADLILVRKNPLKDVTNIRNPLGVMTAGTWYDQKKLQAMMTQIE
jgi:hypothetical protein